MEHQKWQSLLKMGNDCFHDKQWSQAEFFYSEAYDLLAFSYRNDPFSSDILMAWICACHNLSSLYERLGNLELALKFLVIPHEYLKEITESKSPGDDIKMIAFKGMTMTLSPILTFIKEHPICNDCVAKYMSLQHLVDEGQQAVH